MVKIPQEPTQQKIKRLIEDDFKKDYPRSYLGYSELGGKCKRAIWYNFRWFKLRKTSARMLRLFKRGDWEEGRIVNDLEKIGIEFYGSQKVVKGLAGHIFGHIDGLLEKVPDLENEIILAEFKTANQKNFDKFKKDGVLKTNPTYYYQAQSYMGKLKLNKCLFCLTNKNTEERWFDIIDFDVEAFEYIEKVAYDILVAEYPPPKISESPSWYECKYCHFNDVCHFNGEVLKSCRSCKKVCLENEGKWICSLDNKCLSIDDQKKACDQYQQMENI